MADLPPISSFSIEQMLDAEGALDSEKLINGLNQHLGANYQALNRGLTFSQNFAATIKDVRLTMPAEAPWRTVGGTGQPAFENSWVNYNTSTNYSAQFVMMPMGKVWVRGAVSTGTVTGAAFTLPTGYRPAKGVNFAQTSNSLFGSLTVNTTGTVVPQVGSNVWFDMNAQFIATSPAPPDAFSGTAGGQSWPILLSHGLPACRGVVPLSCSMPDQKRTESVGSLTLDWYDAGSGQLGIRSAWGLQWGRTYLLRLLLLSE